MRNKPFFTYRYEPSCIKGPAGWFMVGTIPAYFDHMFFATEEIGKQAVSEAKEVLRTGNVPENSRFAAAYNGGNFVLIQN